VQRTKYRGGERRPRRTWRHARSPGGRKASEGAGAGAVVLEWSSKRSERMHTIYGTLNRAWTISEELANKLSRPLVSELAGLATDWTSHLCFMSIEGLLSDAVHDDSVIIDSIILLANCPENVSRHARNHRVPTRDHPRSRKLRRPY
jgi:hypothetical protein